MLLDILEEHFDEASFLAEQWIRDKGSSQEKKERRLRLHAHLHGLLLGGALALEFCKNRFSSVEAFVAIWMAENGPVDWREQLQLRGQFGSLENREAIRQSLLRLEKPVQP